MTENTRRLLDLYTDYLLVSFGQATATGLSALLPDVVSHDKITRFLSGNEFTTKDLWKVVKPHVRRVQSEDAVLIFDDSIEEKPYTDENEIIIWHFDHCQNRMVKGVNLLTALYHSQDVSLPVDFDLIQKTELTTDPKTGKEKWQSEQTKNEKMRQMIDNFVRKQTPFRYILADAWFGSAENMKFIKEKKGKDFVFPLKSNRRVALTEQDKQANRFLSVSELPQTNTCQRIYLEQLGFPLLLLGSVVTKDDGTASVLYLATSDLTLDGSQITALYRKRWKIEEYHKSIKSNAAFAKSPTRRVRTQSNHFFASIVAFVKLEAYRATLALNHFALRGKVYQAAITKAFEQLQALKEKCPNAAIIF